ncbi:MAG: hypothetical protein WD598_16380 [Acidimicrobiia bacterium]
MNRRRWWARHGLERGEPAASLEQFEHAARVGAAELRFHLPEDALDVLGEDLGPRIQPAWLGTRLQGLRTLRSVVLFVRPDFDAVDFAHWLDDRRVALTRYRFGEAMAPTVVMDLDRARELGIEFLPPD